MSDATASAVEKLEAFYAGLSDDERDAITPLIEGGIMSAVGQVEAEVEGFTSASQIQASPQFLNYLTQTRAPKLAGLAGLNGFVPILPM
jgi:hypothetical protein